VAQKIHFTGNGTKSQRLAVNASLKKLRTDYIDILYCHWYDWDTSIEELMNSLHNLVVAGKVLHLVSVRMLVCNSILIQWRFRRAFL
jgi:aryl-alcohol dehydrogenase-like predicted oxidoreductase